jgi:hypothetical protein
MPHHTICITRLASGLTDFDPGEEDLMLGYLEITQFTENDAAGLPAGNKGVRGGVKYGHCVRWVCENPFTFLPDLPGAWKLVKGTTDGRVFNSTTGGILDLTIVPNPAVQKSPQPLGYRVLIPQMPLGDVKAPRRKGGPRIFRPNAIVRATIIVSL